MKFRAAMRLDLEGICCAALLLRKYSEDNVDIDFITDGEWGLKEKSYDIVCNLPIIRNSKIMINDPAKGSTDYTGPALIEEGFSKASICEMLRRYLCLDDEPSKQISEIPKRKSINDQRLCLVLEDVLWGIINTNDEPLCIAKLLATKGNEASSDINFQKKATKERNTRHVFSIKLAHTIQYGLKQNTQIVAICAQQPIPFGFRRMAISELFNFGASVAIVIFPNLGEDDEYVWASININPLSSEQGRINSLLNSVGSYSENGHILLRAKDIECLVQSILQVTGPKDSFCFLPLEERLFSNFFPYGKLICIEASMKTISSDELKRLYFPDPELALTSIWDMDGIEECVIIQKCNCVEIYLVTNFNNVDSIIKPVKDRWEELINHGIEPDQWAKVQIHRGEDVIYHLYRVTSSLESLIVGDNQVLSQVTSSYCLALKQGTIGEIFSHIFQEAFSVAKTVDKETRIHGLGTSLGRVAVALLASKNSKPANAITVVGSGQIGEVVVNALLKKWKLSKIFIITHRPDFIREKYLNSRIEGHGNDELISCIKMSEAVIFCNDNQLSDIEFEELKNIAMAGRLKIIIDLGMPPNVRPITTSQLVTYSLPQIVEYGNSILDQRIEEAKVAENIVNLAFMEFESTVQRYQRNNIVKKIAPEINKALCKQDATASVIGIIIRTLDSLSIEELDAIILSINNIQNRMKMA